MRIRSIVWWTVALAMAVGCSDAVEDANDFNVGEQPVAPVIEGPDEILFEPTGEGESVSEVFELENGGDVTLRIYEIDVGGPVEVVEPEGEHPETVQVSPGASKEFVAQFESDVLGPSAGEIVVESNDRERPQFAIDWEGEVVTPCVELSPTDWFEFGQIPVGETATRTIRVENCSEVLDLEVEKEGFESDEQFYLVDAGGLGDGEATAVLEPRDVIEFEIDFQAGVPGTYFGTLGLRTDDPDRLQPEIGLAAEAFDDECSSPVMEAAVGDQSVFSDEASTLNAEPLETVQLDAMVESGDSFDQLDWTLIERPEDSAAVLEQPSGAEHNELYLDLAGSYVLELDAADDQGQWACEPARLTIVAVAGSDIHVQLVWNTPGDPNRHNDHGTDMDLHFLHPEGEWDDAHWDCHWQNPEPIWTEEGEEGNPTLDIDATDGWGPENINLDGAQEDVTYSVGANYFTDRGYGVSYATVRLYLEGELVEERTSEGMHIGDFWDVMRVDGDLQQVEVVDDIYQGFPE